MNSFSVPYPRVAKTFSLIFICVVGWLIY